MNDLIFDMGEPQEVPDTCKGLYWRGAARLFKTSHNGYEQRRSLRLLKKKSCPGCEKCEWVHEFLAEDIWNLEPDFLDNIQQGKMYTFQVHTHKDWETGHTEIDIITFVEVEE